MNRTALILTSVAVGVGAGGAIAVHAATSLPPKREALAQAVDPAGAKGRTLGLSRVTVPAGAVLPKHHHAGTQVAWIASGTLTYTVYTGKVEVRLGAAEDAKLVRTIRAGQTAKIPVDHWIVESPTVKHKAENRTKKDVTIYLATLATNGAPPSIEDPS